jgi:hypothetical protein
VRITAHPRDDGARSPCPATVAGRRGGSRDMADVGYALLLLGGFAVLLATLRGLAQL